MKTLEYRFVDKSKWGAGEWQQEPDKVQWQDEATGLPCLIVRGPVGALCGYVGVTKSNPLFNKPYNEEIEFLKPMVEEMLKKPVPANPSFMLLLSAMTGKIKSRPDTVFEVHGGITFSDNCVEDNKEYGICHLPDEGESDNVWWFGFDCAHSGDICPSYKEVLPNSSFLSGGAYRNIAYVKNECARLAKQLKAIA